MWEIATSVPVYHFGFNLSGHVIIFFSFLWLFGAALIATVRIVHLMLYRFVKQHNYLFITLQCYSSWINSWLWTVVKYQSEFHAKNHRSDKKNNRQKQCCSCHPLTMFKSSRNCHSSIFVTVYLTRGLFFFVFFKDVLRNIWAQLVSCPTLASQILAGMEEFASQISVTTKWTMSAVVHWVTWTHDALLPLTTHAEAPHVEMEGRVTSPVSTHSSANVLQAGLVRMCYFLKDTFSHSKSPISSSGNRGSMTSTDYVLFHFYR